jgi:hypothetical protein
MSCFGIDVAEADSEIASQLINAEAIESLLGTNRAGLIVVAYQPS